MSYFAVTIEEISELRSHSNADRLLIASLKGLGFQFIVAKDLWKVGDKCLYFPLDAILPEQLLIALKLEGKLAGGKKNRVKTIKLRGEISQGLVGPLSLLEGLEPDHWTPEEITKFLGVEKYEPEINLPRSLDGRLVELPPGVGIYDIENCERYPAALQSLLEQPVLITEKVEGSHFAVAVIDGKTWICQRRFALEPVPDKPEHFFWEVAKKEGLIEFANTLAEEFKTQHLILRGEILGPNIQSNIYYLSERKVLFFDLQVDQRYVDAPVFLDRFNRHGKQALLVPVLSNGPTLADWLAGQPIREASNGQSVLHKTMREGIVIRPLKEQFSSDIGARLILKQISPEYLAQG